MKVLIIASLCVLCIAYVNADCKADADDCQSRFDKLKEEKGDPTGAWVCSLGELQDDCPNLCGLCGDCKDGRGDCEAYKTLGRCDEVQDTVCRKTCGNCGGGGGDNGGEDGGEGGDE